MQIKFSKELEAAIIGCCLLLKTAFGRTYGLIRDEMFYYDDNKLTYSVMKEMYDQSEPLDLITVTLKLNSRKIELNNGQTGWYLSTLTNQVTESLHLEYHCFLLKEMWQKRELEKLTRNGIDMAEDVKQQGYAINEQVNRAHV
jgi:replicative DNA helicase